MITSWLLILLALLGGGDGGQEVTSKVSGWKEGAAWIPSSVRFFAGFEARGPGVRNQLLPVTPYLADAIEKVGNVRLDRVVVGLEPLAKDNFEFFVRITG